MREKEPYLFQKKKTHFRTNNINKNISFRQDDEIS